MSIYKLPEILPLVLLSIVVGCSDGSVDIRDPSDFTLENKTWVLSSFQDIDGHVTVVPFEQASTLFFDKDTGIVTGYVICNRFTSEYSVFEDRISIATVAPTEMACGLDDEGQSQFVIDVLSNIDTFSIIDDYLILSSVDGKILEFYLPEDPLGQLVYATECKDGITAVRYDLPSNQECIVWKYDGSGRLRIIHVNACLNCCPGTIMGEIDIDGFNITISEAEGDDAVPCYCLCLYDLTRLSKNPF
jgi:heat shock protein HslJ